MAGIKKGPVFPQGYNPEPGMNNSQRDKDSQTFGTTFEMSLGGGVFMPEGAMSGPQVGNAYDMDPMGEERGMVTHSGEKKVKSYKS